MVTIITKVRLKDGAEREWDAAMRDRMAGAEKQPGWIRGQLLKPEREPRVRVIIGSWRSRENWKKWHGDPRFAETRRRLDGLVAAPEEHTWHVGVIDAIPGASPRAANGAGRKRASAVRRKRKLTVGAERGRQARGGAAGRQGRNGRAQGTGRAG